MREEGWRFLVLRAVEKYHKGDKEQMHLLTKLLSEQDEAKQLLNDKGYSHVGLSLLKSIKQLPDNSK